MEWVGRDLKLLPCQPKAMGRATSHWSIPSGLEHPSLLHPTHSNVPPPSGRGISSHYPIQLFHLGAVILIPSLCAAAEAPSQVIPFGTGSCSKVSPEPSLLHILSHYPSKANPWAQEAGNTLGMLATGADRSLCFSSQRNTKPKHVSDPGSSQ